MNGDRELYDAWRSGDRGAGAALFDRYYEPLARFFRNKVDDAAGDDLIQSVFLACAEARDGFRGQSSFRAYLFGVAHHHLYRHYRGRRRSPELVDFESACADDFGVSQGAGLQLREEQRLLLRALRQIPVEHQEVLELHYWEQMDTAEVAQVVGAPQGTVKSRLRRGRELLEEQLRTLAPSRELLESTLGGLDRWATSVREQVALKSRAPPPPPAGSRTGG